VAGDLPLVLPLGAVDVEDAVAEEVLHHVVHHLPLLDFAPNHAAPVKDPIASP